MSKNTPVRDIRTLGVVLRRTNYGEADRILSLLTPEGKMSVMAKGVRRPKSKLAGGIEMFTLSDMNVHFGRSEMGVLTSARMVRHFVKLTRDLERLTLASEILKLVSKAAEGADTAEYFKIVDQSLSALDEGVDVRVVEAWFLLNLRRVTGEELNLYRDVTGEMLVASQRYEWQVTEEAFLQRENGKYGADEIKLARLMTTAGLDVVRRVKVEDDIVGRVLNLVKRV